MEWIIIVMVLLSVVLLLVLILVSAANRETEPVPTPEELAFELDARTKFITVVSEWVASQDTHTKLDVPVFVANEPNRAILDAWHSGHPYALIVQTDTSFTYVSLWPQPLTQFISQLERRCPKWQMLQLCGSMTDSTEPFLVSQADSETAYVIHLRAIESLLADPTKDILSRIDAKQRYVTRYPLLAPNSHWVATHYLDAIFHTLTPTEELFRHLARPVVRIAGAKILNPDVDLVIAYYRASLDWLWEWLDVLAAMGIVYRLFIYSKWERGWASNKHHHDKVYRWVDLANIGRCDHTYVYHLIDTWNSKVAPTTFFLKDATLRPGGLGTITSEWLTSNLQRRVKEGIGAPLAPFIKPRRNTNLTKFTMSRYSTPWDQARNSDMFLMAPASLRPFVHWAEYIFGTSFNVESITHFVLFGVMMFSSGVARRHDKDVWIRAGLTLSYGGNIEIGHYMERMWYTLLSD